MRIIVLSFIPLLMPKLIDYPRTSYTGAWEVAEVVDDTGGKCALETCARKLNRKVSGSFKAIVGSAVKFGLLTSKREMLATTTLFRRIKHAYDKQEELVFHREAFLTPPLFTQLCRKFRARELPVAMLDVLLIREFGVEEINSQSVAKAFIDGARMVNLLDENNLVADIDQLAAQQGPRRELASPAPTGNAFRQLPAPNVPATQALDDTEDLDENPDADVAAKPTLPDEDLAANRTTRLPATRPAPAGTSDAIATLFGFNAASGTSGAPTTPGPQQAAALSKPDITEPSLQVGNTPAYHHESGATFPLQVSENEIGKLSEGFLFRIQLTGPGINTQLDVTELDDLTLVRALLTKIERQLTK